MEDKVTDDVTIRLVLTWDQAQILLKAVEQSITPLEIDEDLELDLIKERLQKSVDRHLAYKLLLDQRNQVREQLSTERLPTITRPTVQIQTQDEIIEQLRLAEERAATERNKNEHA